jgi:hypothetical protein
MNQFQGLFEKFNALLNSAVASKKRFIDIVLETTKITLLDSEITIRDSVVFIAASSMIRNELFMHKKRILEALAAEKIQIKDIR